MKVNIKIRHQNDTALLTIRKFQHSSNQIRYLFINISFSLSFLRSNRPSRAREY